MDLDPCPVLLSRLPLPRGVFPFAEGSKLSWSEIFSVQGPALAGTQLRSSEAMANAVFGADSYCWAEFSAEFEGLWLDQCYMVFLFSVLQ